MKSIYLCLLICFVVACKTEPTVKENAPNQEASTEEPAAFKGLSVSIEPYGNTDEGRVSLHILKNKNGVEVGLINQGATITYIKAPDKDGNLADITLGFDSLAGYLQPHPYFGAVVGRYANRIAGGQFVIGDRTYKLAKNNGPNTLHGGEKGFDKSLWRAKPLDDAGYVGVEFRRISPHDEEGFPGNLLTSVVYWLDNDNNLTIDYEATTDQPTPVNMTNHAYFNLSGNPSQTILDHVLTIEADDYTPVDETLIPTGEIQSVRGTPFDFRQPTAIGDRIDADHEQIKLGGGYDHNFVLSDGPVEKARLVATVHHPASGRTLEVLTTEPGLQFYTGNFLDGSVVGKGGVAYPKRSGFCLETQHFPDSPNQEAFPSTILQPEETYKSRTVYRFGVR